MYTATICTDCTNVCKYNNIAFLHTSDAFVATAQLCVTVLSIRQSLLDHCTVTRDLTECFSKFHQHFRGSESMTSRQTSLKSEEQKQNALMIMSGCFKFDFVHTVWLEFF